MVYLTTSYLILLVVVALYLPIIILSLIVLLLIKRQFNTKHLFLLMTLVAVCAGSWSLLFINTK